MSEHQSNAALVQRAFDAFNSGDMAVFGEVWAPDIRWHQPPGDGPLAGTTEGIEDTLNMFARSFELSGGTFRATPVAIMGGDASSSAVMEITAERDGRSLATTSRIFATVADGKITEIWHHNEDPEGFHAFFAD